MLSLFSLRKKQTVKTIHLAACLLNPRSQGSELSNREKMQAMEYVNKTAKKINLNENEIMQQLASYRAREGMWSSTIIWTSADSMKPSLWWKGFYQGTSLGFIATRILSAPATSAATERSFSTFGWIHDKKRNRLTAERAGKITYLSYNWKLLNRNNTEQKSTFDIDQMPNTNSSDCVEIVSESDYGIDDEMDISDSDVDDTSSSDSDDEEQDNDSEEY